MLLGNEAGRECMLSAIGALRIGAAIVPFNTRSADEELVHALTLAEPGRDRLRCGSHRTSHAHIPAGAAARLRRARRGHR